MEQFMNAAKWVIENHQVVIEGVMGILAGATLIAMLIPGDQPEKAFKSIGDFLSKFSRKKQ